MKFYLYFFYWHFVQHKAKLFNKLGFADHYYHGNNISKKNINSLHNTRNDVDLSWKLQKLFSSWIEQIDTAVEWISQNLEIQRMRSIVRTTAEIIVTLLKIKKDIQNKKMRSIVWKTAGIIATLLKIKISKIINKKWDQLSEQFKKIYNEFEFCYQVLCIV